MFGPHTIVRIRAAETLDPYSKSMKPNWDVPPASEVEVEGCSVQPGSPQQVDRDRRDAVTILFTVWAPITDVTEHDRIEYAGTTYAIDKTIQVWNFPPLSHAVIPLKRVEG